jgi:hypothetical protein
MKALFFPIRALNPYTYVIVDGVHKKDVWFQYDEEGIEILPISRSRCKMDFFKRCGIMDYTRVTYLRKVPKDILITHNATFITQQRGGVVHFPVKNRLLLSMAPLPSVTQENDRASHNVWLSVQLNLTGVRPSRAFSVQGSAQHTTGVLQHGISYVEMDTSFHWKSQVL